MIGSTCLKDRVENELFRFVCVIFFVLDGTNVMDIGEFILTLIITSLIDLFQRLFSIGMFFPAHLRLAMHYGFIIFFLVNGSSNLLFVKNAINKHMMKCQLAGKCVQLIKSLQY